MEEKKFSCGTAVGVSVAVPLAASDPLQPGPVPEAVHEVAPLSDQVNVADAPSVIEVALKDIVGAGGGGGVTVNETEVDGEAPEDDAAENEVDDVSDEGPAEVVDMNEENDTAAAQADAEEKGE